MCGFDYFPFFDVGNGQDERFGEKVCELATSWIELDAAALHHNIAQLAGIMGTRGIGFVVKGNAYGHGLREIVTIAAQAQGISSFFVATLSEAIAVRKLGVAQGICALVPADKNLLTDAIKNDIEIVCPDHLFLSQVATAAAACGKRARVHLKIDTGLSRLGVCGAGEALALATAIKNTPTVELWAVMTHFADAAGADLAYAYEQYARFDEVCAQLRARGFDWRYTHAGASGSLDMTRADSLARVGTVLYGYWKSSAQRARYQALGWTFDVKPVLTWKSRIFHLKDVSAGCQIGYGCTVTAQRGMKLAVVPVGYADGYPRALSNRGVVLVNGRSAPVVGRVSMNLLTIDVTDIPSVAVDDEVVLLGPQPGVTADDLALCAGTVNLDVLTGISPELMRVVT